MKRREFISRVGGAAVKYLAHNPSQNAGSAWLIPPHSRANRKTLAHFEIYRFDRSRAC